MLRRWGLHTTLWLCISSEIGHHSWMCIYLQLGWAFLFFFPKLVHNCSNTCFYCLKQQIQTSSVHPLNGHKCTSPFWLTQWFLQFYSQAMDDPWEWWSSSQHSTQVSDQTFHKQFQAVLYKVDCEPLKECYHEELKDLQLVFLKERGMSWPGTEAIHE